MRNLLLKLRSIEGIIIGFFLIRLYGIWFPPLETWHSWRQTLTNMMARNMAEGNASLFYPTIDMAGNKNGVIGSEFPLFQSIIAGFNAVFGADHWYGRLISLIVASFGSWCFYFIIKRWWNERTATYATVIFLCSLWFSFSRKTMPDTFAVSLFIIGIFWLQRFLDFHKWQQLLLGFIFITLGGLCKIPTVYLFALLLPLWGYRKGDFRKKIHITFISILSLILILAWYFLWVPHLLSNGGFQLFFTKSIMEGCLEIQPFLSDYFKQFYFGALRSYIALFAVLLGIIWLFKNRMIAYSFLFLTLIFILFTLKTGAVFPTHNYYILPFVPVLALLAAIGMQRLNTRFSVFLLIAIGCEAVANQWTDFRIKPEVEYRLTLAKQLNQFVPPSSKIILPSGSNPEWMYWYHRKGWSIEPQEFLDTIKMQEITRAGGVYIVIDKHEIEQEIYPFPYLKIGETKDCILYNALHSTKKIDKKIEKI